MDEIWHKDDPDPPKPEPHTGSPLQRNEPHGWRGNTTDTGLLRRSTFELPFFIRGIAAPSSGPSVHSPARSASVPGGDEDFFARAKRQAARTRNRESLGKRGELKGCSGASVIRVIQPHSWLSFCDALTTRKKNQNLNLSRTGWKEGRSDHRGTQMTDLREQHRE